MTQTIEPEVCQPSCAKSAHRDTKTIRIGLLGCGQVGAAFARLCAAPPARLTRCGIRLDVVQALVRDSKRPRASAPDVINFTDDAHAFLAGSYDVVVEALGGVAAPRSLVVRLLRAGVPVVSANKALIAACGPELRRLAWENHAEIRYEAAAIPGVSFLDAIAAPCFASAQREIIGILNGPSQFILTTLEAAQSGFDDVLRTAIRRGYCEPDPECDVEALDAAHKLVVILQRLGVTGVEIASCKEWDAQACEVVGGDDVRGDTHALARRPDDVDLPGHGTRRDPRHQARGPDSG